MIRPAIFLAGIEPFLAGDRARSRTSGLGETRRSSKDRVDWSEGKGGK